MNNLINDAVKFFNEKNYKEALKLFLELEKNEKDPNILNNIGLCYSNLSDYENAKKYFEEALQINDELFQTYVNLSDVYFSTKQIEKAIKLLEYGCAKLDKNITLKHCLARFYIEDARYTDALNLLEEVLESSDKNYDAYWDLGMVYFELGDWANAINNFEKVIEFIDNNPVLDYQLAR